MKRKYLEAIFKSFTKYKLYCCIQNGYENMPDSFPTDVDIFYRNVTEKDLDRIVKDIFTKYRELTMLFVVYDYNGLCHCYYWHFNSMYVLFGQKYSLNREYGSYVHYFNEC